MTTTRKTSLANRPGRNLSARQFAQLASIPPEAEWLLNITNEQTRRAYKKHVADFVAFSRLKNFNELRTITRAHVIAWRERLITQDQPPQSAGTVRAKISALSSLFEYLADKNSVTHNPVKGVKRPTEGSNEGKTPALSDAQARRLEEAPDRGSLKGKRDAAILSTLLHQGLRREELARLIVSDITTRRGVLYIRVHGKRAKIRYVELHPRTAELLHDYLETAGHVADKRGPLFRPLKNNHTKELRKGLDAGTVARMASSYAISVGIPQESFSTHTTRVTAATKAHENGADLRELQEWLGHSSPATTGLYIRRRYKPEKSPTFKTDF